MTAPVSTTFSVTSGSLATLDRYSAFGVVEPSVHVGVPSALVEYFFEWDFVDTAVHVTSLYNETSFSGSQFGFSLAAYGSNDGTNWTAITLGVGSADGGAGSAVYRFSAGATTDKFFRYLRMGITVTAFTGSDLQFQTANFVYDATRPWVGGGVGGETGSSGTPTGPGNGGVGDDGTGGGANDPGGENDPSTHEGFAMSDLAVYAGDMVLGWLKGTQMDTPPDEVYVALFDGDPDASTPGVELTNASNGLTRQQATFGTIVARYMLNTNKLEFGAPDDDVTVACFCLYDAADGGNRLTKKLLSPSASFTAGTPIIMQPGKLPVYY